LHNWGGIDIIIEGIRGKFAFFSFAGTVTGLEGNSGKRLLINPGNHFRDSSVPG